MRLVLILALLVTSIASLFGIWMIRKSYDSTLYNTLAASAHYSSEDISQKLSNIESMTNSIISNQYIRKSLISAVDNDDDSVVRQNSDNTVTSFLLDYYQNYRNNCISYIDLFSKSFISSSFRQGSNDVPKNVYTSVRLAASQNSGYACWVTDYCNSYGLFLSRDCRRVLNRGFETLGTVVVNVDLKKMFQTSTNSIFPEGKVSYILYKGKKQFYHTPSLKADALPASLPVLNGAYDILKLDNEYYFCTVGNINYDNWDYLCLVPYTNIHRAVMLSLTVSLLLIAGAIAAAFLIAHFMIRSVTRDFEQLVSKMEQFGKDETRLPEQVCDYTGRTDEAGILHQQFDLMAIKIQNLIRQNYINELLAKDAKLKSLESQVNPHFLYNVLDSINWRAKMVGADKISDMVQALGNIMRASLSHKKRLIRLREEISVVHDYITIQKIRFDERLLYDENLQPDIEELLLPPFSIQPLVDNAIHYSMEINPEPCHILLTGCIKDSIVHICVINNGSQFEDNLLNKLEDGTLEPHGIGIGLLNIDHRIRIIFGDKYGLTTYNSDGNHAVAEITLPYKTEDNQDV